MDIAKRRKGPLSETLTGEAITKTLSCVITDVYQYEKDRGASKYTTDGSVDLSVLTKGDKVIVSGLSNPDNNGTFEIDKVDDADVWLSNPNSVEEHGASGTLEFSYEIMAVHVIGPDGPIDKCEFDGEIVYPASGTHVSGETPCDFVGLFFPPLPPIASISPNPSCGLKEYNTSIVNPDITANITKGANGRDLDRIEWYREGSIINTQQPADYSTDYTYTDTITIIDTIQYCVRAYDVESNASNNACCTYEFTYPYFGTSVDIATLTKQTLVSLNANYFQINMVAETDTDKQKAEFHESITITGVEFYNTVSGEWEWLGGDKATSLTYWDTTTVVKDINGVNENYTRYTYNGVKVGARQLRFWRV